MVGLSIFFVGLALFASGFVISNDRLRFSVWLLGALVMFSGGITGMVMSNGAFNDECRAKGGKVVVLVQDRLCTVDGKIVGAN